MRHGSEAYELRHDNPRMLRAQVTHRLAAFLLLPLLEIIVVFPAASQTVPAQRAGLQNGQVASLSAFNPQIETLPPHFSGNNAEVIYGLVSRKLPNPGKSEFESIAEYRARLEDFASRPLSARAAKPDDLFAFALSGQPCVGVYSVEDKSSYRNITTHYDAEIHKLTVALAADIFAARDDTWSALWRSARVYVGGYVGSNAFGVKKRINRWSQSDTVIVIHDFAWLSPDCDLTDGAACQIEVDAQKARALARNLQAILIGSLTPPFISDEVLAGMPTVDTPIDIYKRRKYLHVKLEQLWLVDGMTGHVITKYSTGKHVTE